MRWPQVGAGHMALENSAERVRLDVALQPERRRAPAPPVARLAVLVAGAGVVVPAVGVRAVVVRTVVIRRAQDRLVSVDAEVALRGRGGGEVDDGRDHDATLSDCAPRPRPAPTGDPAPMADDWSDPDEAERELRRREGAEASGEASRAETRPCADTALAVRDALERLETDSVRLNSLLARFESAPPPQWHSFWRSRRRLFLSLS